MKQKETWEGLPGGAETKRRSVIASKRRAMRIPAINGVKGAEGGEWRICLNATAPESVDAMGSGGKCLETGGWETLGEDQAKAWRDRRGSKDEGLLQGRGKQYRAA